MSKEDFEFQNDEFSWETSYKTSDSNFDLDSFIASAESWLDDTKPQSNISKTNYPESEPVSPQKKSIYSLPDSEDTRGIYTVHKQEQITQQPKTNQPQTRVQQTKKTGIQSSARTTPHTQASASSRRKKKNQKKINARARRGIYLLFFPLAIFYMEMVMNLHCFDQHLGWGILYTLIFSFGFGFGCLFIVSLFNRKGAYIASIVLTSILLLIFGIQTVYFFIFKTFTVLAMATMAGDAITGFFDVTVNGIFCSIPWLVLLSAPLVLTIVFGERILPKKHNKPIGIVFLLAACIISSRR